ncbi:hypothetical protein AAMO2058_000363300 [Amorphochlora amoebiformis]
MEVDGIDHELDLCLNICHSPEVDPPTQVPDPKDPSQLRVRLPLSCGQVRRFKDSKGVACAVFDIVFHPEVITRSEQDLEVRENIASFALQNIQRHHKLTPTGKFSYPRERYVGENGVRTPETQRIRAKKSFAKPKIEEIKMSGDSKLHSKQPEEIKYTTITGGTQEGGGVESEGGGGSNDSRLFQVKMPERKREAPLTKEEEALLKDFRKKIPDLKREELQDAIRMFQQKAAADMEKKKLQEEEEKKRKEMDLAKSSFRTPTHSIYCRTTKGRKVSLKNFLGKFFVRTALEEIPEEKVPVECVLYVNLPLCTSNLKDIYVTLKDKRLVMSCDAHEHSKSKDQDKKFRYHLDIGLPFSVEEKGIQVKYCKTRRKLSIRWAVPQIVDNGKKWRERFAFRNPFVFRFVS